MNAFILILIAISLLCYILLARLDHFSNICSSCIVSGTDKICYTYPCEAGDDGYSLSSGEDTLTQSPPSTVEYRLERGVFPGLPPAKSLPKREEPDSGPTLFRNENLEVPERERGFFPSQGPRQSGLGPPIKRRIEDEPKVTGTTVRSKNNRQEGSNYLMGLLARWLRFKPDCTTPATTRKGSLFRTVQSSTTAGSRRPKRVRASPPSVPISPRKAYSITDITGQFMLSAISRKGRRRPRVSMVYGMCDSDSPGDCSFHLVPTRRGLYQIRVADGRGLLLATPKGHLVLSDSRCRSKWSMFQIETISEPDDGIRVRIKSRNGGLCLAFRDRLMWINLIQSRYAPSRFPVRMVSVNDQTCQKTDCELILSKVDPN
jgi:hypothetical protein